MKSKYIMAWHTKTYQDGMLLPKRELTQEQRPPCHHLHQANCALPCYVPNALLNAIGMHGSGIKLFDTPLCPKPRQHAPPPDEFSSKLAQSAGRQT